MDEERILDEAVAFITVITPTAPRVGSDVMLRKYQQHTLCSQLTAHHQCVKVPIFPHLPELIFYRLDLGHPTGCEALSHCM